MSHSKSIWSSLFQITQNCHRIAAFSEYAVYFAEFITLLLLFVYQVYGFQTQDFLIVINFLSSHYLKSVSTGWWLKLINGQSLEWSELLIYLPAVGLSIFITTDIFLAVFSQQ